MYKVYGFKQEDVKDLAIFIKSGRYPTLSKAFTEYAKLHNKSAGTVRNLYYALTKVCVNDKEFCEEFLGGKPISVNKIKEFTKEEEIALIKSVLQGLKMGDSVRKTLNAVANNDAKEALRLQNKYRSLVKNKPELIKNIAKETGFSGFALKNERERLIPKPAEQKLKREIDGLIERISAKLKAENCKLKERIIRLENENQRLRRENFNSRRSNAINFFDVSKNDFIN